METIRKINAGEKFTHATVGDLSAFAGKQFVKDCIGTTGCEISFGTLNPGEAVPFFHSHKENEEVYIVLRGSGDALTGTFERSFNLKIGIAPGLMAFINDYTAIEVNVGVLGFNYSHVKQTTDQVYTGKRSQNLANFKVNIFSLGLGLAFYL